MALRVVHDVARLDWFVAGKLLSWLSAWVFLLCTWLLAERVLGSEPALLVVALVAALNPVFIDQSYSSLTAMFGAAIVLAAILATVLVIVARPSAWLLCGLIFGLAALTRFQSNALLIGAVAGTFALPGVRLSARFAGAAGLAVGGVLPMVLWTALLYAVQDGPPANFNYVHLTTALGEFQSFVEGPDLIAKYGERGGRVEERPARPPENRGVCGQGSDQVPVRRRVPASLPGGGLAPARPGRSVCAAAVPWPLAGGVPVRLALDGSRLAGVVALLRTVSAIRGDPGRDCDSGRGAAFPLGWWPTALRAVSPSCAIVLVSTIAWSPFVVSTLFRQNNWVELEPARSFLVRHMLPDMVVCSTASSLVYGTPLRFVSQSSIMRPAETGQLVERLRQHRVTHFVITERHSLFNYPDLRFLLQDHVPRFPMGSAESYSSR